MTTLDLERVRLRRDIYRPHETDCWQRGSSCCTAHTSAEDVPALIVEVERLRECLNDLAYDCEGMPADKATAAIVDAIALRIRRILAGERP